MERDINVVVRIKEDGTMSFVSGDGLPLKIGGGESNSAILELVEDVEPKENSGIVRALKNSEGKVLLYIETDYDDYEVTHVYTPENKNDIYPATVNSRLVHEYYLEGSSNLQLFGTFESTIYSDGSQENLTYQRVAGSPEIDIGGGYGLVKIIYCNGAYNSENTSVPISAIGINSNNTIYAFRADMGTAGIWFQLNESVYCREFRSYKEVY